QEPSVLAGRGGKEGAPTEKPAQADQEWPGKKPSPKKSENIPARIPCAHEIPQDSPAQPGDEADLSKHTGVAGYVSHESSSNWERVAPPWPTIDKKICSRVRGVESSDGTP